jgi:protein TonB
MAMRKNPKCDLKKKYNHVLEISIIISLSLLIGAFKFTPAYDAAKLQGGNNSFGLCGLGGIFIETIPATDQFIQIVMLQDFDLTTSGSSCIPDIIPLKSDSPKVNSAASSSGSHSATGDELYEPICTWGPPEKFPKLIGGYKSLLEKIEYPDSARKNNIQGNVFVTALIDEEGNVLEVEPMKGIGWGCDEEALRIVREAKFTSCIHMGKPVKMKLPIPIRFRLSNSTKTK